MKRFIIAILAAISLGASLKAEIFDLVIVGGNPGGIMAAIEAARAGKRSVILERTAHIGGLPANGLGATDIATRGATTGLFSEFTGAVRRHYADTYGEHSQQVKDCSDGFHFEPSVAEKVFADMIAAEGGLIEVRTMRQFNFSTGDIFMSVDARRIDSIRVIDRRTGAEEHYKGRIFIDATYEGDLGAAAGVPYRIGREDAREFGEPGAGRTYEYWKSTPAEGSTGEGDNAVQAYNYRLCLTRDTTQMVPFRRPERYDRTEYESLAEDVWTGRHTWKAMRDITPEMMERNRQHLLDGGERTIIPWDNWGIEKLVTINIEPNGKTDANNQHAALISTDLPEENWPWPTSSWEWRDRFAQRLRDYTMGLFWFAATDSTLPEQFRREIAKWGYSAGEYEDNGNFPRQVYVREGRRFEGMYFFTAADALPLREGGRPPLHSSSITASHYALDSHAARKRETGRAHLDGFISYPTAVYT
ncbi:MAG: FAD-dependent oxidoreductase, partial [Muribaculaceae bacterium]|nr:FAD-dependent oxidoreductase [Muribaculaceae bacterium]